MKNEPQTNSHLAKLIWSPTQVGRIVLYAGLLLGYSASIFGGTLLTSIQLWRLGQRHKIIKNAAIGILMSCLVAYFFSLPQTQSHFQSTWATQFNFFVEFSLGFLAAIYFRRQVTSAKLEDSSSSETAPVYKAILIVLCGFPISILLAYGANYLLQANDICRLPGLLNTTVSAVEFRGLKSGLVQELDFTQSCEWNWETSYISTSADQNFQSTESSFTHTVQHQLDGDFSGQDIRILHQIHQSSSQLFQNQVQLNKDLNPDFQPSLPDVGNFSTGACHLIDHGREINGSLCIIKVQYDYLESVFIIRSFEINDPNQLEQIANLLVQQTDGSLKSLDRP